MREEGRDNVAKGWERSRWGCSAALSGITGVYPMYRAVSNRIRGFVKPPYFARSLWPLWSSKREMEDVWYGEWSSSVLTGEVSLARWKNSTSVKLSEQKAVEITAEGNCEE